jgi:23S rRNA pseudouridine2605 synthase
VTQTNTSRRVGLARALSKLGYCSRSAAFDLIRARRVSVNGTICCDPEAPVRVEKDRIEIDGRAVAAAAKVYLILNKPRGVVTTASDEKGRKTVYAFLDEDLPWVAPVGRLDQASEGLLLLTNDSEWSARVLAPETHLEKTYHVQVGGVADAAFLESMVNGIRVNDGDILRVKRAQILRGGKRNTWIVVILDEGKNRHIRRMLAQLGVAVLRLVRVAIGPVPLGQLSKGGVRPLTRMEKQALDRAMRGCQISSMARDRPG